MKPRFFPLVTALLAVGCEPLPPGFERLGPFQMIIHPSWPSGVNMKAELSYNFESRGCQTLDPDFTAAVNGEPPVLVSHGGMVRNGGLSEGSSCNLPGLKFQRPPSLLQPMTLEMSSGEDHVLAEVDHMGQTLGAQVVGTGGSVHAGQRIRIALDPGFDLLSWPQHGDVRISGVWQESVDVTPPSTEGLVEVQLPDTIPSGSAELTISASSVPRVTRCEGTRSCTWTGDNPRVGVQVVVAFDVVP